MNKKEKEALADQLRDLVRRFELCCGTVCDKASIAAELRLIITALDPRVVIALKPDWSKAPKWANWWAVDADGIAVWFERRPQAFANRWCATLHSNNLPSNHTEDRRLNTQVLNWKKTKAKRPKEL